MTRPQGAGGDTYNPLPRSRDLRIGPLQLRFNWFIALCVVMTCGMFINLGLWQLDRAAEKREREQAWNRLDSAAPVSMAQLSDTVARVDGQDLLLQNGQPVQLRGGFLDPRVSFLVMYQYHRGQSGFEVVTPFRAQGRDEIVLVSRGWLAAGEGGDRPVIPPVDAAAGEQEREVLARLHVPELPPARGRVVDDSWPLRVSGLHVEQAGELLGEAVFPYVLRLTEGEPGLLQANWQPPDFGRRMHYGYAVQWFVFTVLVVLAAVLLGSNLLSLLRERLRRHNG